MNFMAYNIPPILLDGDFVDCLQRVRFSLVVEFAGAFVNFGEVSTSDEFVDSQ